MSIGTPRSHDGRNWALEIGVTETLPFLGRGRVSCGAMSRSKLHWAAAGIMLLVAGTSCIGEPPVVPHDPPQVIVWKTNTANLDEMSFHLLDKVKKWLDAKPEITKLRIEVHTDNVRDPQQSIELSTARSLVLAKYLIGKGIDCKRLIAAGFGDTKPIADNGTETGRAENNRTDFDGVEIGGKLSNGKTIDGGAPSIKDPCTE